MMLKEVISREPLRPLAVVLAAGGLLGVCLPAAQADVSIFAQQLTSTGQTPPSTRAVKLFFKGAEARLEVAGRPTLLYDGKGNILYGMDPERKTYYMTVPTEIEPTDNTGSPDGAATENVKLDFNPTQQTRDLAGLTAHQYMVTGTVTFTRSRPQGSGRGGGRRRGRGGSSGGGFPLFAPAVTVDQNNGGYGDGGGNRGQSGPLVLPHWSITGEIWLSDTLKFPAKENTLLAAQIAVAAAGPFQQPLADALDKHKGLPLLTRITVTHTPASSSGRAVNRYGAVASGPGDAPPPVPLSTATTWTVQSVSTDALDGKFFQPPFDGTLVAAPLEAYDPNQPGG